MKTVLQVVKSASVCVDEKLVSEIKNGFLIFVGFSVDDTADKFDYQIKKILNLRVFPDSQGKMNRSVLDNNYEILLVSQFTLYADLTKGNRPSFIKAMLPAKAKKIYAEFVSRFKKLYVSEKAQPSTKVKDGIFGANMQVFLVNDGPVTIMIEN